MTMMFFEKKFYMYFRKYHLFSNVNFEICNFRWNKFQLEGVQPRDKFKGEIWTERYLYCFYFEVPYFTELSFFQLFSNILDYLIFIQRSRGLNRKNRKPKKLS